MLNFVIADDNIYYTKSLINYLAIKNTNLKLIKICTNGKEVIDILKCEKVDLLILDLKMPMFDGMYVLNTIEKMELDKYPYIFVVSAEAQLLKGIINNPIVSCFINKVSGLEKISYQITQELIPKIDIEEIKIKIIKELEKLNYNFKHIGSTYIMEAILTMYDLKKQNFYFNLERDVYNIIAHKYSKSIKNIKVNVCNATNIMYAECKQDIIKNYFCFSNDCKPTPKMIMNTILSKLK